MPAYDPQSGRALDLAALIPSEPAAADHTTGDPTATGDTTSTDDT